MGIGTTSLKDFERFGYGLYKNLKKFASFCFFYYNYCTVPAGTSNKALLFVKVLKTESFNAGELHGQRFNRDGRTGSC